MTIWADVESWVGERYGDPDDPRLQSLRVIAPPAALSGALERLRDGQLQSGEVILRRLGDPADRLATFWRHVAVESDPTTPFCAHGPASAHTGEGWPYLTTRFSMKLSDVLRVFRMIRRSEQDQADHERLEGGLPEDVNEKFTRLHDLDSRESTYEQREDGLIRREERARIVQDIEPDDMDGVDYSSPAAEGMEKGDRLLLAREEDQLDEAERLDLHEELAPYSRDEVDLPVDAVEEFINAVRHEIAGAISFRDVLQRVPERIAVFAEKLLDRGVPDPAAWAFAQACVEVEDRACHPGGPDHAGIVTLFSKGLEHLLVSKLSDVLWRDDEGRRWASETGVLHRHEAALISVWKRSGASWPGVGSRPEAADGLSGKEGKRLRPDMSSQISPSRAAWIAFSIKHVREIFRNGYIHAHIADMNTAEAFRNFMVGKGGLVDFLSDASQEAPSQRVQDVIRDADCRAGEDWGGDIQLCETMPLSDPEQSGQVGQTLAIVDGKLTPVEDVEFEVELAVGDPALDPTRVTEECADYRFTTYDQEYWFEVFHGVSSPAGGRWEPWPSVHLWADTLPASSVSPRSLGALKPSQSTLRWIRSPQCLRIEWASGPVQDQSKPTVVLVPREAAPAGPDTRPTEADVEEDIE